MICAFRCPHDPDSWKTLSDCQRECTNRCLPLPLLRSLWVQQIGERGNPDYNKLSQTIGCTKVLGCRRKAAIDKVEKLAAVPSELMRRWKGQIVHAALEEVTPDGNRWVDKLDTPEGRGVIEMAEIWLRVDIPRHRGWALVGKLDHLERMPDGTFAITDWKDKDRAPSRVYDSIAEQLSLYADMFEAMTGKQVSALKVGYIESNDAKILVSKRIDGILKGAKTRAAEIVRVVKKAVKVQDSFERVELYAELPMDGRTTRFGSKCECDYCDVRDICELAGGE